MSMSKAEFSRLLDRVLKRGFEETEIIYINAENRVKAIIYFKNVIYEVELTRRHPYINILTAYGEQYTLRMRID